MACLMKAEKDCLAIKAAHIRCPNAECLMPIYEMPIVCYNLKERIETFAKDMDLTPPAPLNPTWAMFTPPPPPIHRPS